MFVSRRPFVSRANILRLPTFVSRRPQEYQETCGSLIKSYDSSGAVAQSVRQGVIRLFFLSQIHKYHIQALQQLINWIKNANTQPEIKVYMLHEVKPMDKLCARGNIFVVVFSCVCAHVHIYEELEKCQCVFFIIRQRYLEYFRFHIRCGGMIFNRYGSVELQVYV